MNTFRILLFAAIIECAWGHAACSQGYSPKIAASKMQVAEGFVVKLFASEPKVRQTILVKCDDRGRLWTIQYLQYPNPAGLKRVKVDRWSRTVYDRIPEPPPHGPRGADRITILEDVDGDGKADRFKDFASGLNLATGLAFGHGGVYVLNVPYLLFYPDLDRDDVPDTNPRVLLEGFGMEDAQSLANHLTWGPDGWLYGVNGSTTTCNIRGIEFQQGVWRYHPVSQEFELFCEGGGNTFGLTFDENGELFYSTNDGPFVHAVQGGYFYKSFGKHGPLHNPYAYHYFPPLERDQVPGGPPTGGTIYLGDAFPQRFHGAFIAGNFLGHTVSWWEVEPVGTTLRARYGGELLDARDTWFGPTDMCLGPDGAIYLCDFHDRRTAHPDPDANWDRSNGRIYKIEAAGDSPARCIDLARLTGPELVELLRHRNRWYADQARVLLAQRRDPSAAARLRDMALQPDDGHLALQGLWGLHVTAGLDDATACALLEHPYPYVRTWTVRLVADAKPVSPCLVARFVALTKSEPSPIVRCQLAASAKRLPGEDGLRIVEEILKRDLDDDDPRIPWLLWWAIEDKVMSDTGRLLDIFARPQAWHDGSFRGQIQRLVRRFAAEGTAKAYQACLQLITSAPATELRSAHEHLSLGLDERAVGLPEVGAGTLFQEQAQRSSQPDSAPERRFEPLTDEIRQYILQIWQQHQTEPLYLRLALRAGEPAAYQSVLTTIANAETSADTRASMLELVRDFGQEDCVPHVVALVGSDQPDSVQRTALNVLARFADPAATTRIIDEYPRMSPPLRLLTREVLLSHRQSARALLDLVDQGTIPAGEIPVDELRHVALLDDEALDALVLKHWGNIGPGTSEEKLATMRRLNNDLRAETGDSQVGKALFEKHCGTCHTFLGEGNKIGPDLTSANRHDRAALLANLVDPSAVVRREYMSYVVQTTSGRILNGLLAEQDAATLTVLDAKNQRTRLPLSEVESIEPSSVSLMPEKLLDVLTPQQLRDLFSYLEK